MCLTGPRSRVPAAALAPAAPAPSLQPEAKKPRGLRVAWPRWGHPASPTVPSEWTCHLLPGRTPTPGVPRRAGTAAASEQTQGRVPLLDTYAAKTGKSPPQGHCFCTGQAAPGQGSLPSPSRMAAGRRHGRWGGQHAALRRPALPAQPKPARFRSFLSQSRFPLQWGGYLVSSARSAYANFGGVVGLDTLLPTQAGCWRWGHHQPPFATRAARAPLRDAAQVPGLVLLRMLL